jgi:hypothetical protein
MQAGDPGRVSFQIPGRTVTGPPEHVLEELDEIVEPLLAFRQVVASKSDGGFRRGPQQTGSPPTAR